MVIMVSKAKKKKSDMSLKERLDLIEARTKEAEKIISDSKSYYVTQNEELFQREVGKIMEKGDERAKLLINLFENHKGAFMSIPVDRRLRMLTEGNEELQKRMLSLLIKTIKEIEDEEKR